MEPLVAQTHDFCPRWVQLCAFCTAYSALWDVCVKLLCEF